MAEPSDAAALRPQAPDGSPDPGDPSAGDGAPPWPRDGYARGFGHRTAVRGGHPEHREPGGGWGADASGRGPEGGAVAGRVLQGTPGGAMGGGQPSSPRQDYLDAFDDALFGKAPGAGAASAGRAPAPRHPESGRAPGQGAVPGSEPEAGAGRAPGRPLPDPGPAPLRGPRGLRPSAPGQWHAYEGAGPVAFPQPGRTDTEPLWSEESEETAESAESEASADGGLPRAAPPPRGPAQETRTGRRGGGSKGRAVTGVLAVAVATVLAFAVAGQITSGIEDGEDGGEPGAGAERGLSADGPASRSDKGREAPGDAQGAAPSYTEKLGKTFPLKSGLKGKGDFKAVPGTDQGAGGSEVMRYRVDVEKGLPLESELFAKAVQKTLNDRRSWAHGGERSFERVSKGDVDFVITLASSPTTDVWCAKSGLDTSEQNVSCDSASTDRVMINAYRWAQGSKTFGDDKIRAYRQMLINHEVGHRIGRDHVGCPKDGAPAPVMMQQTKSLTSDGAKCRPNPWPHPDA